jgi:hypothetical protein
MTFRSWRGFRRRVQLLWLAVRQLAGLVGPVASRGRLGHTVKLRGKGIDLVSVYSRASA